MRKKDLAIALEKVPPFEDPDPALEQYPTPANLAADIVFEAYAAGDIAGLKVMDLGCGTGMFAIAAWLMGAGAVTGYDVSSKALQTAATCAAAFGAPIELKQADIRDIHEGADTVLMNPPFGSQNRNADRPFLAKAMECAECVYSLHMADTLPFVKRFAAEHGWQVTAHKIYKYDIPHTFSFHTKAKQMVEIVAVLIR